MRGKTAGPAEKAEGWNLTENVVGRDCRGLFDIFGAHNSRAGRHFPDDLLGPCDDVDPLLGDSGQFEFDLQGRAVLIAHVYFGCFLREAFSIIRTS